jgi:hypothetical protein
MVSGSLRVTMRVGMGCGVRVACATWIEGGWLAWNAYCQGIGS